MNESISRSAGAVYGQEMPPERMEELIRVGGPRPAPAHDALRGRARRAAIRLLRSAAARRAAEPTCARRRARRASAPRPARPARGRASPVAARLRDASRSCREALVALECEQIVDRLAAADEPRVAVAHEHGCGPARRRCSSSSSRACTRRSPARRAGRRARGAGRATSSMSTSPDSQCIPATLTVSSGGSSARAALERRVPRVVELRARVVRHPAVDGDPGPLARGA